MLHGYFLFFNHFLFFGVIIKLILNLFKGWTFNFKKVWLMLSIVEAPCELFLTQIIWDYKAPSLFLLMTTTCIKSSAHLLIVLLCGPCNPCKVMWADWCPCHFWGFLMSISRAWTHIIYSHLFFINLTFHHHICNFSLTKFQMYFLQLVNSTQLSHCFESHYRHTIY